MQLLSAHKSRESIITKNPSISTWYRVNDFVKIQQEYHTSQLWLRGQPTWKIMKNGP